MDVPDNLKRLLNKKGLNKLQSIGFSPLGTLHSFFSDQHKEIVLLKIVPLSTDVATRDLTLSLAEARTELGGLDHPALPQILEAWTFE